MCFWNSINVSWFGRAALVKMSLLPRILYIMQTVPQAFFSTYRKTCTQFVWRHKHPQMTFSRLILPKHKGGIGLPVLYGYYIKDWVALERSQTSLPLGLLLWLQSHLVPTNFFTSEKVCTSWSFDTLTLQTWLSTWHVQCLFETGSATQ